MLLNHLIIELNKIFIMKQHQFINVHSDKLYRKHINEDNMGRNIMLTAIMIILMFSFIPFATAQKGIESSSDKSIKSLIPYKTDTPPKIDGVLDDPVWEKAPFATGFKTWNPDYEKPMGEKTQVWYAYDYENLYFAFRCFDSQPDKIKSSVSARDKIRPDDWVCLNLDTFNDHQSIYAFYSNPAGIQMDSRATAVDEDLSIDVIFYSEGRIDDKGYTVEIKIPFKSIRFSHKDPVKMGIIFERKISRLSEQGTFPALDPKQGPNFLTQNRPLVYRNIKHYRLVEILPAVTYGKNSSHNKGKMTSGGDNKELSFTAKYGITSHLIFDGTVNPDFSQVEADAGQVDFNQRSALYYPEKRPFFLEGRENFKFGGSSRGDPLGDIVYTRRISNPASGVKLTGKITGKNTIAAIYAKDELEDGSTEGNFAHFGIFRYKRALNQDSFLGGFYAGRELNNSYNRVYGADGQIRINGASSIGFHAFQSADKEINGCISQERIGFAAGANYYYRTRDMLMNLRIHDISKDFRTRTGYISREGLTRIRGGFQKKFYPNSKIVRRIDPLFNTQHINDKYSNIWEHYNYLGATFVLPRNSRIRIGYSLASEIYMSKIFNTDMLKLNASSQFTKQFYFSLAYYYGKKIRYINDPYQGKGNNASARIIYQLSDKLNSTLDYSYSDFYRDSGNKKEFDYSIIRSRNTFQINKYLFFRTIVQYNSFYEELKTDLLASFTYIPGTVVHIGYGSLYERIRWESPDYVQSDRFLESRRGLFFKTSYLWRM